jgi:hypothetical protein
LQTRQFGAEALQLVAVPFLLHDGGDRQPGLRLAAGPGFGKGGRLESRGSPGEDGPEGAPGVAATMDVECERREPNQVVGVAQELNGWAGKVFEELSRNGSCEAGRG